MRSSVSPAPSFLLIGLLLVLTETASARTWIIRADGNGDAPTIQAGVDSASAADTVLVRRGTYTGFSVRGSLKSVLFLKSGVTVRGEFGAPHTVIDMEQDPSGIGVVADSISYAVLRGFTITGADPAAAYGIFITGRASLDVVSCRFEGPGGDSWAWGAYVRGGGSAGITIDSCYFNGWGSCCYVYSYYHPAAVFWDSGRGVVRNSLFEENDGPAVLAHYSSLTVENNTIVKNAAGIAFRVVWSKSRPTHLDLITHNIITGNDCYGIACYSNGYYAKPVVLDDYWNDCECNDVWGNGANYDLYDCDAPGNCGLGYPGRLQADPLFCDPLNGNYHLRPESPCTEENSPEICGRIGAFPVDCLATGTGDEVPAAGGRLVLAARPNPFNATVEIEVISPAATDGRVEIVGVAGRRVRLVYRGPIPIGTSTYRWDGRNGWGEDAASGT